MSEVRASHLLVKTEEEAKELRQEILNGKKFEDATVSYTVVDQGIANVDENGIIVAKSNGKTQLVIEATWCSQDAV